MPMNRRRFLAAADPSALSPALAWAVPAKKRPNMVLIMTDQQPAAGQRRVRRDAFHVFGRQPLRVGLQMARGRGRRGGAGEYEVRFGLYEPKEKFNPPVRHPDRLQPGRLRIRRNQRVIDSIEYIPAQSGR